MALDYIQLVETNITERRELEISTIGRSCKKMAKQNNIHVFGLSQLDDSWGGRGQSQKPTGRNLRESKALKHHTDNLLILRRTKDQREVEVWCDKLRNSQIGGRKIGFIGSQTRFVNSKMEVPPNG